MRGAEKLNGTERIRRCNSYTTTTNNNISSNNNPHTVSRNGGGRRLRPGAIRRVRPGLPAFSKRPRGYEKEVKDMQTPRRPAKKEVEQNKKEKQRKAIEEKRADLTRHKPYGLTAWIPTDDVYLTKYYPKPVYEIDVAIQKLKKFQELDFTDPKQYVYINLRLDMKLEKKKKVDSFVSTINLPHPLKEDLNKVLVFTENPEETEVAEKNGASFVGGEELVQKILDDEISADFYIAVPAILPKIMGLKNKLRKVFPKSKRVACSFEGKEYQDGEEWNPTSCMKCHCNNGDAECYIAECQPVICKKEENLIIYPGQCCPQCVPNSCFVSGTEYKGQVKVSLMGKCCEVCVSSKGSCLYEGLNRYHGEMWNSTACEFCICERGQVLCHKAECAKVECAWGEELIHLPGKCCPECLSASSFCVYKGMDKENFEKFHEGPCRECECRDSQVMCYQKICPVCPVGSLTVSTEGECCPHCKPVKCHSDCLTCSQNPEHCEICMDEQMKLQNGDCVQTCDSGFYESGRICKACKETCATCLNEFECESCEEGLWMKYGKCVPDCGEGFYADYRGYCSHCHPSCKECKGPSVSDCTTCHPLAILVNGHCTTSCLEGQYLNDVGYCIACNGQCLTCDSAQTCTSCKDSTKVLLFGECQYEICAPQYYLDISTRTCKANSHPPILHVNGTLIVQIGGVKPLDLSFMSIQDLDTIPDQFVFYIVSLPNNGKLVKIVKGKQVPMNVDDTFTLSDLQEQAVRFIHSQEKSKIGHFTLKVSDQQLFSQPGTITVQAVSLQAPYVLANAPLQIKRGEAGIISSSSLNVQDNDNPQDVLIMVLESPRHGRLVRIHGDLNVQQFKLEDLERSLLQYIHDGGDSQEDTMVLQMNDGHSYQNIVFQIVVTQKSGQMPSMLSNIKAWVSEGGMLQITKRYLDAQISGSSDSEVVYTITPSTGNPKFGEMILIVPMPADSPSEGWTHLLDGRAAAATSSFTQQDINDGIVWYKHSGVESDRDSFQFQLSRGGSLDVQSDKYTFQIGVIPKISGVPQLSSGASLHLTAFEDRVTVITPAALSFEDTESPSEKLVYNITKSLIAGQGTIENIDRPNHPAEFFTQADINQGKVVYRPPMAPSHIQELYPYSFTGLPETVAIYFTVSDGEEITQEMEFTIHLVKNQHPPPFFQLSDPFLEVSQGGRASLGQQLAVSDADTAPEDLIFELLEAPHHGEIIRTVYNQKETLETGDGFTFEDISRNSLHYVHHGLDAEEDSMEFSVSDGISVATSRVRVVVSRTGNGGPKLAPGSSLSMEVSEKSSTVIRRTHIAYTDDNSPDDKIRIQLISLPMYGILTMTKTEKISNELTEFSSFTIEDINHERIRYTTSFETDNQPVTDIFHFVVYDADNNRLDNQMCTITISSVQAMPLVITVSTGLEVHEGGKVLLSDKNIHIADPDTPKKDILIRLITPPKYGYIENTKGGSSVKISPDVAFSFEDVISNHVYYVQNLHKDVEYHQDSFTFYITDGLSQTESFNINIDIQNKNDEPPRVAASGIIVEEASGVVIRNSSLTLLDLDTPENELILTVTKKPDYGKLRRRQFYSEPFDNGRVLIKGSSFTYQDVLDELIVYTPDSLSIRNDEFHFSVTDGVYTEIGRLEFTLDVQKNEAPRLTVNRGLQLAAGSVAKITEHHLKATDIDSDAMKTKYIMTKDPLTGRLQLSRNGNLLQISVKGPIKSFTQTEINTGSVEYKHEKGEQGGSFAFKFDLSDSEGNKLIDQSFYISVLEDKLPPSVTVNKGLVLDENSVKKITTLQLSATDQDSEPGDLIFRINKQPQLGYLEHTSSPGNGELHPKVVQTFYITIRPVDDSLPLVHNLGMRVQEGVRKTITEFELKATDADTEAESITFTIVQVPRHGIIERTNNGQHFRQTNTFTMDDVYQNRISYNHDGSNSIKDRFTFTVSDGTNQFFVVEEGDKEIMTVAPQRFKIDILPVDDGTPRIVTNLGLQWLEYMDNKATNLISKKELLTVDPDTEDKQLIYEVTTPPKYGYLESKMKPGIPITTFTQEEVNLGMIRFVLNEQNVQETMDNFKFLVKDSKPNVVSDNVFHIQWSLISFEHASYNVSEKASTVSVMVKRTGNLNQYAIVLCRTEQGTATSTSSIGSKPGQHDYVEYAGQVQFDEREDTKACVIVINDDHIFENMESFNVELSMPAYALLGKTIIAKVNINDTEDEPTLQFDKKMYHVNESDGFLFAPVERKGDSSSTVSALCYTVAKSAQGSSLHALESGSDFKSRGMTNENRVVFGPGVSMSTCDVKLIDDSEFEEEEEFEIVLTEVSENARIGNIATARVMIDGPNDASTVFLENAHFAFSEDAGVVEIRVIRQGTDLSAATSVWCATRPSDPPSASPGVDYIPSSKKVEFRPGKTEEVCSLTIMDDTQNPAIEGNETFIVFLSSAHGAELAKPNQATVTITDTFQDVPSMQFIKDSYAVQEKTGVLNIPVIRTGDLTYESSVRCYTRMQSAKVMDDFEERSNSDNSRIIFQKGEKIKNCTVQINDDSVFEPEEQFQVYLSNPLGNHWSGATVGKNEAATITITNDEDAPTIEFEESVYQVREPPGPDGTAVLNIKVIRKGDQNRTSKVRCSTRDGSAQSGVDYNPKSRVLKFSPGIDHILFKVEILSNEDREWHESFSLVLGPDDPVEAVLGEVITATVTILDQEAAGSLILPAPPIVVSLTDYDFVQEVTKENSKKTPSPGYPLVCVTPCDPHYPKYSIMKERCEEAGINQSSIHFSWEVAAPTDTSGARSPFETITDNTPYTSVNHMVLESIYFSRRFHVRCVAKAIDKAGHLGTPLRSNIVTIGTEGSICHTPVVSGTGRGFQAQSFIASLKYLDVKHKEHPNRIHISVQIPHQDGMLPLISTMPLHNLHFLLSESIYRHQHICSNLVTLKDLQGISESGFLDDVSYDSISLGPGFDRPYQFDPNVREAKSIQLYKHLNLKSCIWTFDAYYDMTELIDVCGGSVTADFQVRDSAQSFLTVQVPLYVSYIYVTAPRGWASLEHHTEMEFSFFYDTVLWRTGIQTDSVLSARLQIIRIYIREDGRLVIEFKTHAKFRGQTLYGRVLWNPEQNLNSAYKLQLEKVYLCTGRDGYVPFFDPTGTLYNEGPQYGCIQPNKHLKHRFLLLDRNQPEVCDRYFHDVPFEAYFASDIPELFSLTNMPGVDGFTMKVDALYKVEAGHQWYLQVIYVIGPESISRPRIQRSVTYEIKRSRRDLVDKSGRLPLDESLIYDNEGDQVKNGTNMKTLRLDVEPAAVTSHTGSSVGGALASVTVVVFIFLASCFLFKKCHRKEKKKTPVHELAEMYPLNTKVEACIRNVDRLEKNLSSKHKNVNILNVNEESCKIKGVKVKQVNLEVKIHNNLHDGTEV
ncbi:FRAS1 protein, partial [Polypterus senegalus]